MRLLVQLALGGVQRVLAGHVQQAGGDLPQLLAHRVPVLAQHHGPVRVVEGEDGHGPQVDLVVAVDHGAPGMTTSSVRTEVFLPTKGVCVPRISHSSGCP